MTTKGIGVDSYTSPPPFVLLLFSTFSSPPLLLPALVVTVTAHIRHGCTDSLTFGFSYCVADIIAVIDLDNLDRWAAASERLVVVASVRVSRQPRMIPNWGDA